MPKRHARRAVTRSLLKRQMRGAFGRHAAVLPAGLWLLRLRAPFPVSTYVSASSSLLATTVRDELEQLFDRVGRGRTTEGAGRVGLARVPAGRAA